MLDLQDELTDQGHISRLRLIWDMLAGALLARAAPRAHIVIGAAIVIGGLAVGGAAIGGLGADSSARTSHPQARRLVRTAMTVAPTASSPTAGPAR